MENSYCPMVEENNIICEKDHECPLYQQEKKEMWKQISQDVIGELKDTFDSSNIHYSEELGKNYLLKI